MFYNFKVRRSRDMVQPNLRQVCCKPHNREFKMSVHLPGDLKSLIDDVQLLRIVSMEQVVFKFKTGFQCILSGNVLR